MRDALRHSHATMALAAGVHPKVVQERLGHSSVTLTLDTYSHAVPTLGRDAAVRLNALLGDYSQTTAAPGYKGSGTETPQAANVAELRQVETR